MRQIYPIFNKAIYEIVILFALKINLSNYKSIATTLGFIHENISFKKH